SIRSFQQDLVYPPGGTRYRYADLRPVLPLIRVGSPAPANPSRTLPQSLAENLHTIPRGEPRTLLSSCTSGLTLEFAVRGIRRPKKRNGRFAMILQVALSLQSSTPYYPPLRSRRKGAWLCPFRAPSDPRIGRNHHWFRCHFSRLACLDRER